MRVLILPLLLLVPACDQPDQRSSDDKIAEIEQANRGQAVPVAPEKILYPDIERHALTDPACAFAPEGGGLAPVALAMADRAVMKVSGDIVEFAPDKGAAKGPNPAWTKYDGREWSLRLAFGAPADGAVSGRRYAATLELRDGKDRPVYQASGYAQCPD